jgi:hypothetical protein
MKRDSSKTEGSYYGRAAAAPSYYGNPVGCQQGELQDPTVKHEATDPPSDEESGTTYAYYAQIVKVLHGSSTAETWPMHGAVLSSRCNLCSRMTHRSPESLHLILGTSHNGPTAPESFCHRSVEIGWQPPAGYA